VNGGDPRGPKADSCGRPFFRTRLGILDEAGKAQRQGEIGEVAVVGIPDDVWGESVKAVLVLDEGVECAPSEIEQRCRAELAGYKIPRVIAFTGTLPRTGSGKVLNRELASVPGFRRADGGWSGE
jgi:acyl-CoA synthetase (AMP-forming)/AMP-acid ligase II